MCRISTPRRFGKTISVCLFVAALIFACPNVEISIYSTCKRISQKLLRNCVKFLSIIHDVLNIPHLEFLKQSSDEVELRGGESKYDARKLNSYPSKVGCIFRFWHFFSAIRWCQCPLPLCVLARKTTFFRRMLLQKHTFAGPETRAHPCALRVICILHPI